jgi:RHH-type proline utilization regulon transcriptional repressor/proline dehydrogenase/delta 1-pyrroline-5-carboxylate dehydrogenase
MAQAIDLIEAVRGAANPGLMEVFLAEYGLSTDEGVALMCLAEALLRVPDAETIDALIEDKIAPSDWGKHLGKSSSSLVNASTWALLLTGKVLKEDEDDGLTSVLRGAMKRLGEPAIRAAVAQAMREMGRQFVLGRTIEEAMERAAGMEAKGFSYSYDMLGEAARTEADARRYHLSYSDAITAIAKNCGGDIRSNPGISVKLSALHPRYEFGQRDRVMDLLVERTLSLALLAKSAGMGFNIDAEEADRLDLSLDVIEAVLSHKALAGWDGFGVVVQAYGPRAPFVLDWLYDLAARLDRRLMVRLVKGAYWDTEIKRAQVLGLDGFPVFTRKPVTDVSYIACARKLLSQTDHIYPQFATHNAHTAAAVLEIARQNEVDGAAFEFQRLHGMGEVLHTAIMQGHGTRCRIYAPVGAHRDLLAYLVRRLLENGANSSFVNQLVDEDVAPAEIAADPFETVKGYDSASNPAIATPALLFGADRRNAKGYDITDPDTVAEIDRLRGPFKSHQWTASPTHLTNDSGRLARTVRNPADAEDVVGTVTDATAEDVTHAVERATAAARKWADLGATQRADSLRKAANLYEAHAEEFFALAAREAGKTMLDAVGEVREAVDFLRYYAAEAQRHADKSALGVFACISPWNFPLAIFTGQLTAALAAGNCVVAKPAEQTPLIAARAVALLHEAGIPKDVLQLLPGDGSIVGAALSSDPRIDGLCFTGSTGTAQAINRSMAQHASSTAPLIAETGGLNAMIVDSTALPEQAVRDILASSFQSAGQRCSALRVLYVQADVADTIEHMLFGAMEELQLGDPWLLSTDVGPVIDAAAKAKIDGHIENARVEGRVLKQLDVPHSGTFCAPTALRVNGIGDLEEEIFGPVLHIARFESDDLDQVIADINATGYGLTFGLHTRIDDRVEYIARRMATGNIYVNRNQIGAVVGSQPFGGEGFSGTGPKAGGPDYLPRFTATKALVAEDPSDSEAHADTNAVARAIASLRPASLARLRHAHEMPGPTGESNRLLTVPRGVVLCLGPGADAASQQARAALEAGNAVAVVCAGATDAIKGLDAPADQLLAVEGVLDADDLAALSGFDVVMCCGAENRLAAIRSALAGRNGAIIPLIADDGSLFGLESERHICIDTTAAGGNASLLAAAE